MRLLSASHESDHHESDDDGHDRSVVNQLEGSMFWKFGVTRLSEDVFGPIPESELPG